MAIDTTTNATTATTTDTTVLILLKHSTGFQCTRVPRLPVYEQLIKQQASAQRPIQLPKKLRAKYNNALYCGVAKIVQTSNGLGIALD